MIIFRTQEKTELKAEITRKQKTHRRVGAL